MKYKHNRAIYGLIMLASAGAMAMYLWGEMIDHVEAVSIAPVIKKELPKPEVKPRGTITTVGAFSDVECGSAWCNRHEPKDGQVALNLRKWPGATKVYIPAFDKYYRVVGNTYSENGNHLDLEIWFGNDREAALEFGIKKLLVNVL